MSVSEFSLIQRYFSGLGAERDDVGVDIGDDGAVVTVPEDMDLVVAIDTLVSGVHFPVETSPFDIGYKALAVNLSDLAAMGAEPAWITLALTLPESNAQWLAEFSRGMGELARKFGVRLIGGDTTKGPLTITVQAHGFVPKGESLRRDGAKAGDLIYVTGQLGDAGLALLAWQGEIQLPKQDKDAVMPRLNRPQPRLEAGLCLRRIASSAIDISDGLAADLGHILESSGVGATLYAARLPVSDVTRRWLPNVGGWALPLSAGDDYELCFTVPDNQQAEAEQVLAKAGCRFAWVGLIESTLGLRTQLDDGSELHFGAGYTHF